MQLKSKLENSESKYSKKSNSESQFTRTSLK